MGERVNFGIRLKKWRTTTICSKLFLFNPEKRVDLRGSAGADAEDLGWILQGWKSRAGLTSWERNMYIYIYVDQRWELLAVLLQVFGLKKLLWMYDYLKILPSSHIALCKISQIFLWTVFVIINTFCWDPTLGVGQSYRPNISLSDHQTFSIFWCHAWMAFEGRFSSVSCDTRCMLNTLPSVQFSSFVKHFF